MAIIRGTEADDRSIVGTDRADFLFGLGGNDRLSGGLGNDELDGGAGTDRLLGEAGNDRFVLRDDDSVDGGTGFDSIRLDFSASLVGLGAYLNQLGTTGSAVVNGANLVNIETVHPDIAGSLVAANFIILGDGIFAGNSRITGGALADQVIGSAGQDEISGLAGSDQLSGGASSDQIDGGDGDDVIRGDSGGDILLAGAAGDDLIFGGLDDDTLQGGSGADELDGGDGRDVLYGGTHADHLQGGRGQDYLYGGSGRDHFVYRLGSDSEAGTETRDVLPDFGLGADRIDLRLLDADRTRAGDQRLKFIGEADFAAGPGSGQLRFEQTSAGVLIQIDLDRDLAADMEILLQGRAIGLVARDFFL